MSCCFAQGNQLIKKQGEKTDRLFFHLAVWWLYELLQDISVCLLFVKQNRQFVNIVNVHSLVLSTMYSNKKLRTRTRIQMQVLYCFACVKDCMSFRPVLLLRQSWFHSYHLLLFLCVWVCVCVCVWKEKKQTNIQNKKKPLAAYTASFVLCPFWNPPMGLLNFITSIILSLLTYVFITKYSLEPNHIRLGFFLMKYHVVLPLVAFQFCSLNFKLLQDSCVFLNLALSYETHRVFFNLSPISWSISSDEAEELSWEGYAAGLGD